MFNPAAVPNAEKHLRHDAGVTMRNLFYYMGILSSRGPVSRSVAPEPKVVQRRAREGRAPWVSYSLISLPHGGDALTGRRSVDGDGALRSSPRQHWRRGHVRQLPSGTMTAVSPCLVGASELGQVIASYHIAREATASGKAA